MALSAILQDVHARICSRDMLCTFNISSSLRCWLLLCWLLQCEVQLLGLCAAHQILSYLLAWLEAA
jgi:hypothetical protein